MTQAAGSELDERVPGRRWTVRLDAAGRGSAAVRISCSRPACAEQRLPSAAAGRAAAVAHLKAHLRAAPAPRTGAHCACRAEGCQTHLPDTGRHARAEPWRCGGPVVLAVVADRGGRWWQAMECCSRCAAATPGARTAATSQAPGPQLSERPDPAAPGAGTPQFSDHQVAAGTGVPAPRSAPVRRRPPQVKIAQRVIPHSLRPVALRDELMELGGLFRAYQQRDQPDLALLADLHTRKASAFAAWAEATGDTRLRLDAQRAEQAATAARFQHQQRTGVATSSTDPDSNTAAVARLLSGPAQWAHARSVLAHVTDTSPLPGPEARLLVVMLTLRTARTGTGNLVGQDVTGLGLSEPEDLVAQLADSGWLRLPGTPGDLLTSRPENPTPITVPSLVPDDKPGPFTFGKKLRPKLSGWAQKVVSDKKLRKTKTGAGPRLLALVLATHSSPDGRLGPGGQGIDLDHLASWCAVDPGELTPLADRLAAADWLTEPALTTTHLTGRLTERVLPLTCPLT
ncbi:hypothetical protein OG520_01140 [Streptomyces sp. NBC_00984]|uniref:hypothetical protein n=1 Tax=Streptomyces sp. NBC_00984 TaxID=2903700 RepID=UPI00386F1EEF|nr:hypothetical protein OG520_01140 [Streptomyces sp. NBC_00984]